MRRPGSNPRDSDFIDPGEWSPTTAVFLLWFYRYCFVKLSNAHPGLRKVKLSDTAVDQAKK